MGNTAVTDMGFIPETAREIDNVRERCRRTVRKRAVIAAGVSAVPIPGVDVVSDLSLFAKLVDETNQAFGLTPEQIDRLKPKHKLIAYQAAVGVGGMLVGKFVTRELLIALFKRMGVKSAVKSAAKFVPFAGQLVSAGIGYAVFRHLGYQHVEACASVAKQLRAAGPGD